MTPRVKGVGPAKPNGGRPGRSGPKAAEERAHIEARRATVEHLETAGVTMRKIAEAVQVDVSTVWDDVQAIRKRRRNEFAGADLQVERDLELARLEQQRSQLSAAAAKGVTNAHTALLQIATRKAKLLGLDAPQQVHLSGEVRATLGTGLDREQLAEMLMDDIGYDEQDEQDG